MAIYHKAYIFGRSRFERRIVPLIDALGRGEIEPIFNEALGVQNKSSSNQWVFNEVGDIWPDIESRSFGGQPRSTPLDKHCLSDIDPMDIGYWLMIILSKYVDSYCGLRENFSILSTVLEKRMGWAKDEIDLLVQGMPLSTSIFSDYDFNFDDPKKNMEDIQLRMSHTKSEGLLPKEQIRFYLDKLLLAEKSIKAFDHREFSGNWLGTPILNVEGQKEYKARLNHCYHRAIVMLEGAILYKKELLMIMHY